MTTTFFYKKEDFYKTKNLQIIQFKRFISTKMYQRYFFNLWRIHTDKLKLFREYDDWCKIHDAELRIDELNQEN